VYDYDVATRERTLKKRQEIPSGFDASRYQVHRRMAPARDGVQVPVSILLPKKARLDGSPPLLLYAYGSYGYTTEPTFNSNVLSLVDRGMIYAIAHVRGGQEMGRQWYDDGKMLKKMNTFHDFIDVAEYLVKAGYTRPDRLVANGGSAGGLLMGVVANVRPDLFKAIVADVPFVDVINTMLDASLPLTAQEWEQWGNPQTPEHFAYLRQYSPYDNVRRRLSVAARDDVAQRLAGHVLGAGQVGGEAAGDEDRRQPAVPEDEHGGRARRQFGPLRAAARDGVPVRVHAGCGGPGEAHRNTVQLIASAGAGASRPTPAHHALEEASVMSARGPAHSTGYISTFSALRSTQRSNAVRQSVMGSTCDTRSRSVSRPSAKISNIRAHVRAV
jgi:hypothetical protein